MHEIQSKHFDEQVPKQVFHTLLVFRAPTTLSEALAARAAEHGVSVSALIRKLLTQGLEPR